MLSRRSFLKGLAASTVLAPLVARLEAPRRVFALGAVRDLRGSKADRHNYERPEDFLTRPFFTAPMLAVPGATVTFDAGGMAAPERLELRGDGLTDMSIRVYEQLEGGWAEIPSSTYTRRGDVLIVPVISNRRFQVSLYGTPSSPVLRNFSLSGRRE